MIKTFLTFFETAAELGTDYDGLRVAFETGLSARLPAYIYSSHMFFFARLVGTTIELRNGTGYLMLSDGRTYEWTPNSGALTDPEQQHILGIDGLGDELGNISISVKQLENPDPTFLLEGYFRVATHEMKRCGRFQHLGEACVAPASWWREDSSMPKGVTGDPAVMFRLEAIGTDRRDLPKLKELRFRTEDVLQLKSTAEKQPAIAPDADRPINLRERRTLLCVIGALADSAKLDLSQHNKAGEAVAAMLAGMGVTISGRAIGEHLKAVRGAMDSRMT